MTNKEDRIYEWGSIDVPEYGREESSDELYRERLTPKGTNGINFKVGRGF